ncbi:MULTISPECIES: sensor histidine kinase [Dyella]|uniref:histidine kinase n=2 Tax=Dyella TaxID=231454 RepID=A0A4R0YYS5_9GAMM|nr:MULTISPECIES: sensor histidine kinase [Dyella]TBR40472.1 GHKL domain-containing protein [Dyella terrae]TCI11946.1 GHKL domain-containing protein [Dyella soli]
MPSLAAKPTTNEPESPRRPFSLAARAALATGFVLAAFLGVVGLTLSRTSAETGLKELQDRLQNYVVAYLAGTEVGRSGKVLLPDTPPDPRFSQPGSGLYALAMGENGAKLESPSAIGRDFNFLPTLEPGESQFVGPIETRMGRLYYYAYGVALDTSEKKSVKLTFMVAQAEDQLEGQNAVFRRSLGFWLASLGVMLILLQLLLLRWSLTPLRKVASDMTRVERGDTDRLDSQYPLELTGLTERINAFIDSEREQRVRYRNTLADLAHSLKTPLAVIRSRLESVDGNSPLRNDVLDQVRRMDELVAYQLARAATTGRQTFATAIPIAGHAEDLVQSLEKVYAAKNVLCEFDIDDGAAFYGEQGDLLELMGNLLENAFKWARHRVLLVVKMEPMAGRQRPGLFLSVEDDGPGIDDDKIEKVLQRGVRGDERVQGHGIGLSIVQDIVKAYRGELSVDRSEEFGGARFSVTLPPG